MIRLLGAAFTTAADGDQRDDAHRARVAAVLGIPLVTDIAEDVFSIIRLGDLLKVDGNRGTIEILHRYGDGLQ